MEGLNGLALETTKFEILQVKFVQIQNIAKTRLVFPTKDRNGGIESKYCR